MQTCENCNTPFSWGKIYGSFLWNYQPITCKECQTIHKITISSRFVFVSFTILPMLIFGHFLSPFHNILLTLGVAILICIVGSLLAPYFVTYKRK
ncbi:TIGR04104 family putative zinc finger protein [Halalkalibacter wakoensis]|uniref:TIGR04104 family putative zinc finger protein n=1 Tax=Halalkalibacter wakoensis TaxID=127891 RepID=UPI0009DFD91C